MEIRPDRNIVLYKSGLYRVRIRNMGKFIVSDLLGSLEEALKLRDEIEERLNLESRRRIIKPMENEIRRRSKYMTRSEIAKHFNISPRQVKRFCEQNNLECVGEEAQGNIKYIWGEENRRLLQQMNKNNFMCKRWAISNEHS